MAVKIASTFLDLPGRPASAVNQTEVEQRMVVEEPGECGRVGMEWIEVHQVGEPRRAWVSIGETGFRFSHHRSCQSMRSKRRHPERESGGDPFRKAGALDRKCSN